jgi:hypothetical protein
MGLVSDRHMAWCGHHLNGQWKGDTDIGVSSERVAAWRGYVWVVGFVPCILSAWKHGSRGSGGQRRAEVMAGAHETSVWEWSNCAKSSVQQRHGPVATVKHGRLACHSTACRDSGWHGASRGAALDWG